MNSLIIPILIVIVSRINGRETYLNIRNNFLKFYLNLENYRLKRILHSISVKFNDVHYYTIDKFYDLSFKYYTLSDNEKEILEAIMYFT